MTLDEAIKYAEEVADTCEYETTYVITQVDGANVDKYHYEWLYHSNGDLIPIEIEDADK